MLLDQFQESKSVKRQQLFDFFQAAGAVSLDFAYLTRNESTVHEATRFLNMKPVLPTEEIMNLIGVKGGPELGSLLKELKRMQFLGKIPQKEDPRRLLTRWLVKPQ